MSHKSMLEFQTEFRESPLGGDFSPDMNYESDGLTIPTLFQIPSLLPPSSRTLCLIPPLPLWDQLYFLGYAQVFWQTSLTHLIAL